MSDVETVSAPVVAELKSYSSLLEKDKTVSFSIDQVNDNPDELIALRGEGRYFGVTDVLSGPICSNCHRRGHMRNKCKVVVCHACGLVDDHYENQCPKSMVCTNCGKKGHFKGQCQERMKRTFCVTCESKNHSDDRCPSIWRSYLTIPNRETCTKLPRIYCYNCGRENHYGDECNQYRSSKTPNIDGSGFSGNNLPRELRDVYYKNRSNESRYRKNLDNDGGDKFDASLYGDDTNVKKRKMDETSRSGYLNNKKNEMKRSNGGNKNGNGFKRPKKSQNNNNGGGNFPRTPSNSGKLSADPNKHKRGFLPFKLNDKKSYHKRF